MRQSPAARKLWWLTMAVSAVVTSTAVGLSLFPAHTRASGSGGVLPENAALASLQPDSSIFLLADLPFPSDGLQTLVRENGAIRRMDLFQNGKRISSAKLDHGRPYCAILTSLPGGSFVERIKRLQITGVVSTATEVRIHVISFQESAIEELRCHGAGLTITALREALGHAEGDDRITLLGPAGPPPATEVAANRPTVYREALTAHEGEPNRNAAPGEVRNLLDAHRAYLRYLETLHP